MRLFVSDFQRQMLKATEILASDWLRANLTVKITDKMLHETLPRCSTWVPAGIYSLFAKYPVRVSGIAGITKR